MSAPEDAPHPVEELEPVAQEVPNPDDWYAGSIARIPYGGKRRVAIRIKSIEGAENVDSTSSIAEQAETSR